VQIAPIRLSSGKNSAESPLGGDFCIKLRAPHRGTSLSPFMCGAKKNTHHKNNERRRGHRPGHHDQVPATHIGRRRGQRPGHYAQLPARRRGQRPGATAKHLRCTTSGAAGNGLGTTIKFLRATAGVGLGTTIKYLCGAAGIGLGTTFKFLRCATSAAANNGLGTTAMYLVNQNAGAENNWTKAKYSKALLEFRSMPLLCRDTKAALLQEGVSRNRCWAKAFFLLQKNWCSTFCRGLWSSFRPRVCFMR
jgi:hypothetical protein